MGCACHPHIVGRIADPPYRRALREYSNERRPARRQFNQIIRQENPGLPVFFFGHSMGSLIAQRYIQNWMEAVLRR
jgi:alpha-beta hydrolase superfamily lysophospholipase